VQGTAASRPTLALSRGPATTGRVTSKPLGSLQAQKMSSHSRATSTQYITAAGMASKQRPTHPLSSDLPREVTAAKPCTVSNQATSSASAGLTVRGPSRQGALRHPSETGPSTMQSTNRRRDIPRPLDPTIHDPQRVGNMLMKPHNEKPRVGGGARRVLIPSAPLPETDDTAITRTVSKTGPPSVKPSSVNSLAKTLVSKRDSKTDPVTMKTDSTASAHTAPSAAAATTRPSSRTGRRSPRTAKHPTTRGTNSRIGQSRSQELPTTEVEQTSHKPVVASSRSSQQVVGQKKPVWGGRSSTKVSKPVVKALSIRSKLGGMNNPDTTKPAPDHVPLPPSPTVCPATVPLPSSPACSPHQSRQFELPASGELSVQETAHDLHVPQDVGHPSINATPSPRDIDFQESPSKTPITALFSSIQRGFLFTPSSPLSPPQGYVTEIITHTNSPMAHKDIAWVTSLVQDSTARQALEVMDIN